MPAQTKTLADARALLKSAFGYDAFRPGQEAAVSAVLSGRDTVVVLPTGGGKSLCFQVPALLEPGLTVVVSPLISLMKDQVDALVARGLPAAFINSSLSAGQVSDRLAKVDRGEIKLLYVAPERFDYGRTAERLRASGVSLLAIDEAHCISQWGHDFRPSYLRVKDVRTALGSPTTIALTATATPEVRRDIIRQLGLVEPETIITGFDRPNLTYYVVPVANDAEKEERLVEILDRYEGLAVIYASTRKAVDQLSGILTRARISAAGYHAGLDDARRREVQEAFMSEKIRAIVATNAFGMGIDKPNVRLVVHYAMPGTLEAYYQEAGRAGRDGKHSDVFLLHAFPDRFTHEFFIKGNYPERVIVEHTYAALRKLSDTQGLVSAEPADLLRSIKEKSSTREIEGAIRILEKYGAVAQSSGEPSRVHVRLLAASERIKRELTGEANQELGLLRALWRGVGANLKLGANVDLAGMPPGLGGAAGCVPLLEALEARQFLVWERLGSGLHLTDRNAPFSKFGIDWALIDRRRAADLAKLQAVQKYAYTKECRRGFVLRYFGDPAARPRCEGCDNCLGVAAVPADRADGRPKRGKRRGRVGAAAAPREKESRSGERSRERVEGEGIALDPAGERVFVALKTVRTAIAREEQVPAYIVFSDRTLAELAARRPRSLAAFKDVRGVGPMKLERYGARFLAAITHSDEIEAA
ncbi:MAG TPA: ATP-dependent DNA helicase RecQ [Gemmatimonadaceae bacterium]|nr:ATP-dependent DNA helicase RecQ [Gemmatimonadaceae bacterium]